MVDNKKDYFKGRGAQVQSGNRFLTQQIVTEHMEGLDEPLYVQPKTEVRIDHPKTIVNPINSPDLGLSFSLNPYQGCEHGCIYCYARNSHEYYGFTAGLDFETKLMAKPNAPKLLEKRLLSKSWKASPISLSGNTDCYQPLEKEMGITRELLKVFARYRHPVGLITKNSLILRDLDLLQDLASENLVQVYISITTLEEDLRRKMEPRTASAKKRLSTLEALAKANIPVAVMNAPIIPGLNHYEIPQILKAASDAGALGAGYTVVRLNGQLEQIFSDWLQKNYPDRFNKVMNQIAELHGGNVNDSQFGRRMKGEGPIAECIRQLFNQARKRYFKNKSLPKFNLKAFHKGGTLSFDFG
ncbi:PA0069 family radical SAM protein [Algoriphagus kandeliae]|uniref:PA0069 family radical SAM protein n=1 Tax=Algoriphagus kandeliae TaxID=2562278 RepID=A0A4Y9QNC8_9BACT|nr:PA0069 family radical SAM protein [Algoriphagus kandeliae]TFV94154.1 PA0069 family radical SAM protein [Algoriphagus kandeliae]